MNRFNFLVSLFVSLVLSSPAFAQTGFYNANNRLTVTDFHSGCAISVADWNVDGLDDIVRMDQGHIAYVEIQNGSGQFQSLYLGDFGAFNGSSGSAWGMAVADVDHNGYKDILAGGNGPSIKIMYTNAGGMTAVVSLPSSSYFMQNATFGDFNNDGWIDVFACNDVGESKIWTNNQDGTFAESSIINFDVSPTNDSGNYGSVWTDFDNDGDLDLYIAKCRQGVLDPGDARRIDVVFVNDGNNNYTEMGEFYNLNDSAQTWTASFGDIDNDGDLDVFRTQENQPANLYVNDGTGHYTNGTAAANINLVMTPIQSVMADFDNDGFVDILASGDDYHLLHNNGDGTFTELTGLFNNTDIHSFAIGDLNHDGFVDVYAGYATGYTSPSSVDDVLWLNATNDNHFLVLNLKGTVSNANAIGARALLYGSWGVQLREVRSGESYGTANSQMLHFGIGANTSIDSVVIKWPSGIQQTVTNPGVDQFLTVIENECVSPEAHVSANGPFVLCSGQTLDLTAPSAASYEWNTGETTQTITVGQASEYFVEITEAGNNCTAISAAVTLILNPDETPVVTASGPTEFCSGNDVLLQAPAGYATYLWSDGQTTQNATITESGTYTLMVEGTCESFASDPVTVDVLPAAAAPLVTTDTAHAPGESVVLTATGDNVIWFADADGTTELGVGNEYTTPVLTSTTTYYVASVLSHGGTPHHGGEISHTDTTSEYSGSNSINAKMYFNVFENVTLASVKVYTDRPGTRIIKLYNNAGSLLNSTTVDIQTDTTVLTLNFPLTPGTGYYLTTDGATNLLIPNWPYTSPRLRRTSGGLSYPYNIENLLTITGSDQGNSVYYYFYDWVVKEEQLDCMSPIVPVEVFYDNSIGLNNIHTSHFNLHPNPTNGMFYINVDNTVTKANLSILDATGRVVMESNVSTSQLIDASQLAAGFYNVKLQTAQSEFVTKLVIQR